MLPRTLLLDVWIGHLTVTVWKLYIVPVVLVYVVSLAYLFECFLSFLLKFSWLIQTISILKGGVSVPGASNLGIAKIGFLCWTNCEQATKAIEPARWEFLCWKLVVVHLSSLLQFNRYYYSSARILCGVRFHLPHPHPPTHPLTYTTPMHTNHFLRSKETLCMVYRLQRWYVTIPSSDQ